MKTGLTAIAALVVLAALTAAAPGLAQPTGAHGRDRSTFSVSNTPASSCAGFFAQQFPSTFGWAGELHESYDIVGPAVTNVSVFVNGSWTDPSTGLSYHIKFRGDGPDTYPTPFARGDVDIRRSDGLRLSGVADYDGEMALVSLASVSCG